MSLVRKLARPMLGAIFIYGGIEALRNPAPRVAVAKDKINSATEMFGIDVEPDTVVMANAAAMVGAGSMLAIGKAPRLAASVLSASVISTTLAGHPFWEKGDPKEKAAQRTQFLKNLGLLGGVLLATVDTGGKPGLAWRAQRARRDAAWQADRLGEAASLRAQLLGATAKATAASAAASAAGTAAAANLGLKPQRTWYGRKKKSPLAQLVGDVSGNLTEWGGQLAERVPVTVERKSRRTWYGRKRPLVSVEGAPRVQQAIDRVGNRLHDYTH